MTELVQDIVFEEVRQGEGMPINRPLAALGTKWPVKRRAAVATDSLRSGGRVLSVCACATHSADSFCLFCFAKYQNTGIPASITSVITIVPNRE
jgi:hypothetical protein